MNVLLPALVACVVGAWLGLLVAMRDRRVTEPKPRRVNVTLAFNEVKFREAMARAAVTLEEFGRAFAVAYEAVRAAPSMRQLVEADRLRGGGGVVSKTFKGPDPKPKPKPKPKRGPRK